jgi:hypothetical protein
MSQRLEIEIGLSKDEAVSSARRLRSELKGISEGVTADAKAASEAEINIHRRARDERGKFAKEAAANEKASFAQIATAAAGTLNVISAMSNAMRTYSNILDEVRKKEADRARSSMTGLEKMRELAALQGEKPSFAFAQRQAAARRFTLQTADEQIAFGKAVADGGAQFVGRTVTPEQDKMVRDRVAALAVAKGIGPDAAGTLLGKIYGARDWRGQDAQNIVTEFGASAAQLAAGTGDASHLAGETTKVMAALSSDDAMRGRIRGPAAAARMVSMVAESSPGEEATGVRALAKGLYDFQDVKSKGILTASGIKQTDDLETALGKIAPEIERRAKAGGVPIQAIIGQNFADEQVRTNLAGALTAMQAGVLDQRRGVEAQARAPGGIDRMLGDFRGSDLGAIRVQRTQEDISETELGLRAAPLDLLEQRARTRLKGSLEAPGRQLFNMVTKGITLGGMDLERSQVDMAIRDELLGRAPADIRRDFGGPIPSHDDARRKEYFGAMMGRMSAAGVDPLTGGNADPILEELKKQTAVMEDRNAPPKPLVATPPTPRR